LKGQPGAGGHIMNDANSIEAFDIGSEAAALCAELATMC